jgi:hypothetical protein
MPSCHRDMRYMVSRAREGGVTILDREAYFDWDPGPIKQAIRTLAVVCDVRIDKDSVGTTEVPVYESNPMTKRSNKHK